MRAGAWSPTAMTTAGFSGASLDRPALQSLLSEIQAGKIDIIVVYKVDRLTRSLADFAKLVELFDQHSVSFVSVTQSFNTTSSMGRLTLNVLLSFAQFEREVIGERVRDKIAASKRKGIWVGGPVPLGYASVNKKLVVVPEDAETVRLIFRRYLELGSIRTLVEDLDRKGIRTRRQVQADGRIRGGIRFGVGPLAYLLRNRFFIGEVDYRGDVYTASRNRSSTGSYSRPYRPSSPLARTPGSSAKASPSILTGRIFDDRGNRMTPTHANKRGARYRYYVSHVILEKRSDEAGSVTRVPAHDIEVLVIKALREQPDKGRKGERQDPVSDRALIEQHLDRIVVRPQAIEIQLKDQPEQPAGERNQDGESTTHAGPPPPCVLEVPWSATAFTAVKGILYSPSPPSTMNHESRDVVLTAIAKARTWIDDLVEGRVASFADIAKQEGRVERHIRLLAPLAFISPRIVSGIAEGSMPDLKVTDLAKAASQSWARQDDWINLRSA